MGRWGAAGDWDRKKQTANLSPYIPTNMYETSFPQKIRNQKKMLPLPKSNSILIKLYVHLAQLSVLPNQLYFIPTEISGSTDYQEGKRERKESFARVDFCKFLVL